VSRNPVVRGELLARGLTDEELGKGWALYTELHGFGSPGSARPLANQTFAAQAINELDAWDAPAFTAAHAVLDMRYPEVSRYLFDNLQANVGVAAVVGVELFLNRIDQLREGKADGVNVEAGQAAVALLATRRIIDPERAQRLRGLIEAAKLGARPDEVATAAPEDPRRSNVAESYIHWLHEWREVARVAIGRRDYRISLGIAQRRTTTDDGDLAEPVPAEA
jgi:hypothetical protein